MSKVYGYCRLALANDVKMTEQCFNIYRYCKDNGLRLERCFCDNGVSGLNSYRGELNKMLYILQSGDMVVITDIARLSRNMMECISLMELMKEIGITLKIIN